ncbi:phosphate ABC transporter substrate-binding protein [Mobiluncus curtisii]|uniref:phosphate ABC transporter substrate-binding protein n=1 Tax=Mobiluncus curtisii TaxID=2051 RepID=UPI0014706DD5|nr:phosphate ABC transporter substrate-binding protein [Mobiluncus curtisii]MCU9987868.1 phosphate ABC transporter substrate-binding protein [Mobiluncus curtisii]NMW48407.1 phosphate ABC transporter substrate-binding protein [Mobiluncus curtisii]
MKISRIGAIFGAGLLSMSLLTGCAGGDNQTASGADAESSAAPSTLSGTVTGSGSSALLPLAKATAEAFMQDNPNVTVTMNGGGSGEGLKQVAAGSVNIGNSDVFAAEKLDATQAADLVDHKVCTITMAPVVNKDLGVTNLTTAQLTDVFTGKTTNWKEVGGPDEKIVLVTRPSSSGTRALFKTWALGGAEEASNQSLETDDSGTLLQTVSQNKGAIGYVALSYLVGKDEVQPVAIDGVKPTLENTYSGKYKVWGYEHMYTKGNPDAVTKAFLDYMMGDKFAADLEKMGYGVSSKMSAQAAASHPDPAA